MTPVGHAAVSFLAGKYFRLSMTALIVGGIAPDLDFLLLPFAGFNMWHRVITHNVFFVLVVAGLLACAAGKERARVALAAVFGGGLHLLVDSMLDSNPSNGIG